MSAAAEPVPARVAAPAEPLAASAAPLRVAVLSPCFWPEVRRGGERFAHELATGLLARGHRPRVITSHRGLPARGEQDGVPVVRVPRPPDGRLLRRRYEEHLTHLPFSAAALALGRDDIAHAIYPTDALVAARWTARTGRPSVLSYLGVPDRVGLVYRRKRLDITLEALRGVSAVTALSQTAAEAFRYWLGVEARVIYPGVDLETFRPGLAPRAEPPTIFCSAAAGEPRKRVDLLVEAFALVRRERPDARLVLSRPRGERLARRLAAADGVELADVDDRDALARANAEAWVSVLPSFGEAFGLVLVEAMACGTPVVGAGEGAIPEVVDSPAIGRLFEEPTPDAVARSLLEALELGQDQATAHACRARAEQFSTQRTTDEYLRLYAELRGA